MDRCLRVSIACPLALLCAACLETEHVADDPTRARGPLEVRAVDARGEPADLDRLPRRAQLQLEHPDGVAPIEDAIVLLAGPADLELLADLARAPLSAAQRARVVASDLTLSDTRALLAPRAALTPGARYTLAVAAWARSRRGASLSADGAPAVFELRVDAALEAGARPLRSWPADGASGVGTNLEAVVIAFDGLVHGAADGLWLEGPDGLAVATELETGACAEIAAPHAGSFCARLLPVHRLAPEGAHRIAIGAAARDGRGSPIGPWYASFRTAEGRDARAPGVLSPSCAIDEAALEIGCALIDDASIALRLQADEAVTAQLQVGAAELGAAAPDGQLALRASGLAADSPQLVTLVLRDVAGNQSMHAIALRTSPELPALSIVEVLADPLGPEPQQEFVELLNHGSTPIDLLGFSLTDALDTAGMPLASPARVEPHARALLVATGFDPREGRDVAPLPGAALVRVGASLASAGLRNAGEPLFLRDPLGRRISAAPATPRPRAGVCLVRTSDDPRTGDPAAFAYDPAESCTPGR